LDPGDGERVERAPDLGAQVIQVTYNRLNRAAEQDVLAAALRQGCGVLAREPLANGSLSGRDRPGRSIAGPDDWRSARPR
jgi:aryl-alcohol dehydrogenase-like predicted oxidoreductase